MMSFLRRAAKIFRKEAWRKYRFRRADERRRRREVENYQKWISAHLLTDSERWQMKETAANFALQPLISIVLPVYNVDEKWLRLCIESVFGQIYENWELCIADDCSPSPHIREVLEEYEARDERVKVVFRQTNGHISAASNSALEAASGEFCALLDHDDELSEDALFCVVQEINCFPEVDFIYTDEDMTDENGTRYTPKFKPDFSRDFLYSVNYVTHLAVYKTQILRSIGGWREGLEGSQDYDLALRVIERIDEKYIRHIPRVLYHWRAIRGSVALDSGEKPYAHERAREAIRGHFERTGKRAEVSRAVYNLHRVRYLPSANPPKISLILHSDNDHKTARKAIKDFIELTDYENVEIILTAKSQAQTTDNRFAPNVKFVNCELENDAERCNLAAAEASGEILCFADINLKPLATDWLAEIAGFAVQPEIGAVGAKILDAHENVLHGGLIIADAQQVVRRAHAGHQRESGDNIGRLQLINNFSAVSIACLAIRKKLFEEVGGFDAENLPNHFFDADFCLKLREKNQRVVYTPYAELIASRTKKKLPVEKNPSGAEKAYFAEKWAKYVECDPFYNPNLSKKKADFSIEI